MPLQLFQNSEAEYDWVGNVGWIDGAIMTVLVRPAWLGLKTVNPTPGEEDRE